MSGEEEDDTGHPGKVHRGEGTNAPDQELVPGASSSNPFVTWNGGQACDLQQPHSMAIQGPMTALLVQQTWSSSQEEQIIRHTIEGDWGLQWMEIYNKNTDQMESSTSERNESFFPEFSFPTEYSEVADYMSNEAMQDEVVDCTAIFNSMQVQEVRSRSKGAATSEISEASTSGIEIRRALNESHDSIADLIQEDSAQNGEINGSQELMEQEIEEFIREEQEAAAQGNNAPTESKLTPQIDMLFDSREDAIYYFSVYAFMAGFKIVLTHQTKSTSKKKNYELYKQEMRCHRYGKEQKKTPEQEEKEEQARQAKGKGPKRDTNVQVKTNCPVLMDVKLENSKWRVVRLDLDHNHELSLGKRNQMFSGRKYMTGMEREMIRTLNASNIPTRKMIAVLSYLRGFRWMKIKE